MLLTLYRIRYSNHRQIRRKSLAGQQDCIHQRHHPAPNFGKTFGVFVTSGLNWNFEDTSSLSEIGCWERKVLVRQIKRGFRKFRAVLLCAVR